jgi:hypothetical protein
MAPLLLTVEQQVVVEAWNRKKEKITKSTISKGPRVLKYGTIYLKNFSGFDLKRFPTNSGDSPSLKDGRMFS